MIVSVYAYNRVIKPKLKNIKNGNKRGDIANNSADGSEGKIVLHGFFADWCPACQKQKPAWNEFMKANNGKVIDGIRIECIYHDVSDKDDPKVDALLTKYGIKQYPTIIGYNKDGERVDFDAKVTESNLMEFVKQLSK